MIKTKIIKIDEDLAKKEDLEECGEILRKGGVVAFPTETVYGLGGNALDVGAVKKIFEAKGRPSDNPLIVHVAHQQEILPLVKSIPKKAERVMKAFWPGPLTLIFEKSEIIPKEISAGLPTVAIRMPSHPIAQMLIELAGVPIAAPSANRSGRPSPTKPHHVIGDLMGRVEAIISGGSCDVGVESTVLDLTGETPMILRPGSITKEMLEEVLGRVEVDPAIERPPGEDFVPKAPGMKYTHYSPKAPVAIVQGMESAMIEKIKELRQQYEREGKKVGIICTDETYDQYEGDHIESMGSRRAPETIAASLFKVLRDFDDTDVDMILAEAIESVNIGQAIMNRLVKAAGYHVIRV